METKAILAFNLVEVKVEAELGNYKTSDIVPSSETRKKFGRSDLVWPPLPLP